MQKGLFFGILISFLFHVAVMFGALRWGQGIPPLLDFKQGVLFVDFSRQGGDGSHSTSVSRQGRDRLHGAQKKRTFSSQLQASRNASENLDQGKNSDFHEGMGKIGQGGGLGGSESINLLGLIKRKIYSTKRYPLLAKRRGLEGISRIKFELNADGSLKYVKIIKSSGHAVLDEESLLAVKRAEPFPYFKGPIAFNLKFQQ